MAQELDVTTAEYDPVNKVLSFDAHSTLFRMTGDSLRELAKEVHELRIRFLDGNGQEMEAVIPLARIKDLVGVNGAFELELSQEGLYRFYVVGQTGYDRKTFSDETALRRNGKELVLVYRVGDEEQKAQETPGGRGNRPPQAGERAMGNGPLRSRKQRADCPERERVPSAA